MSNRVNQKAIVADIGGTNARFATLDLKTFKLSMQKSYTCCDYDAIEALIRSYLLEHKLTDISKAALAFACPIHEGEMSMTNLPWRFTKEALKSSHGFGELLLLNDFEAIALSLKSIPVNELALIGEGNCCRDNAPKVIIGPGTGLGVAYLVYDNGKPISITSEAGHMSFAPQTEKDVFIQQYVSARYGRASIERLISGPGLEDIYSALLKFYSVSKPSLSASSITTLALNEQDTVAIEVTSLFLKYLASFAGDLALSINAYGGVYFAGGILPKLLSLVAQESPHFK
jgi:glucokinase